MTQVISLRFSFAQIALDCYYKMLGTRLALHFYKHTEDYVSESNLCFFMFPKPYLKERQLMVQVIRVTSTGQDVKYPFSYTLFPAIKSAFIFVN